MRIIMVVSYNGKSIEVLSWVQVSEEERIKLQKEFYEKPDFSQVIKQFETISKNGVMMDKITRYYFKELMAKVVIKGAKWSVEDVFNSKDLLGIFKARITTNNSVFDSDKEITNIETAIRLGGHSVASMPANFPIKIVRMILNKYNINNNWYDFSCGWGARLLGALSMGVNYYGTDPNYLLVEKLLQLTNDYDANIGLKNNIVNIKTQGSEIFIPEWENKIGLAFSSPPYFDLEDYVIGKQSYTNDTTYQSWQENYLIPTIKNIYRYLIDDGILAINIKNGKKYKLADDVKIIADKCNFQLIDIELLTNNQRNTASGLLNNSENIFIFKKKENKSYTKSIEIIEEQPMIEKFEDNNINNNPIVYYSDKLDIYLIGVRSKKQLDDKEIYNSDNKFLGERYFATFNSNILDKIHYELNKYVEMTKQDIIKLLNYASYHRDCNNSFKTVVKLCEIIDTWEEMEENNYHVFLQIENN